MVKYLVDLPTETTAIVAKKRYFLNETDLMRIPVSQLELYVEPTVAENATVEKRVIELPADSIAWLERMKSNLETIDVYDLLNNVLADTSGRYVSYQLNFNSETAALNTVAEWLLGHVEFVPKKEPKFYVEVELHDTSGNQQKGHIWQNDKHGEFIPYMDIDEPPTYYNHKEFTEQEADNIIEKLGGEKGLLKSWKVKVEE